MYVRWKRTRRKDVARNEPYEVEGVSYPHYRRVVEPAWLLSAVLVESRRVNGKPRQRTVGYLGSIRESHLTGESSLSHRDYFWRWIDYRLDRLNLSSEDRARAVAAIEERVPRPGEEEAEQHYREARARMAVLKAELRGYL